MFRLKAVRYSSRISNKKRNEGSCLSLRAMLYDNIIIYIRLFSVTMSQANVTARWICTPQIPTHFSLKN